ncbi:hypothetical protein BJX63DRAFT_382134 [Aspergillus granulosus]|uniref:Uncharacterized protein n=1 Tax=Aspergillus granulosus TaxID=176169 RepID=A0ABR4HVF5_9EURO
MMSMSSGSDTPSSSGGPPPPNRDSFHSRAPIGLPGTKGHGLIRLSTVAGRCGDVRTRIFGT